MQFQVGKFYRTRMGVKALVVDINTTGVKIFINGGRGHLVQLFPSGRYCVGDDRINDLDLLEEWSESVKRAGYINVYRESGQSDIEFSNLHPTLEDAVNAAHYAHPIARIYVEFCEGQFDS